MARDAGARGAWGFRAWCPRRSADASATFSPTGWRPSSAARLELRRVDWAATRAFVVPSDAQGLIRLNVRGRERNGVVDPGEAAAVAEEIREGLESFTLESGKAAVAGVDAVSGLAGAEEDPSSLLPDLVVRWSGEPTHRGERLASPRFGTVRRPGAGSGRSGNDTDDAWALVVPGSGQGRGGAHGDICDIAATALARFGLAHTGTPLLEAA